MSSITQHIDINTYDINGIELPMVTVPAGRFWMGDDESEYDSEKPGHWVDITNPFQIGQFPVTQELWEAVMKNNPSSFKGARRPVEKVSWKDICDKGGFLDQLNQSKEIEQINAKDGKQFRLPTEAQWEYAARGGTHCKDGYTYSGSNRLKEVGWYRDNSHRETKPVGLKMANQLEFYDMSGNVREWCADHWHENYNGASEDGAAREKREVETRRVVRGGSWYFNYDLSRVAYRRGSNGFNWLSDIGFRLARY